MLYAIVVFLGVMADQLTKLWVSGSLMGEGVVRVIPGIINFRYVENTGMAFSMMSDMTLVLTVASGVLTVVMGVLLWKLKSRGRFLCISLSLIMAGAIGNLIDRIFAGFVVDFIEFAFVNFAVFNVADICVCVGTAMLVIYILFLADRKKEEKKVDNQNLTPQETAEQEAAAKAQWRDSKAKLKLAKAEEKLTREQQKLLTRLRKLENELEKTRERLSQNEKKQAELKEQNKD